MRTLTQPLNMSPGGIPPVIHVSQYDSDFTIVFTLFSTVGDFTIESGTTAMVRGTKSSGTGYSADATINISAKTVTVTGNQQMTAAAGQNIFEITLLKGNKEISSKNFILLCERAALDADTITDESVLKELNAIIESADTATQAAEEAEDAADRAEAAAQSLVIDPTPTRGSSNAVSSGGVWNAIEEKGGLSEEAKVALLACFQHVAWTDAQGKNYYDALEDALYPDSGLVRIEAVFIQSSTVIYESTPLNDLKAYLTITGYYNDGTSRNISDYVLSGALTVGESTITVSAEGKMDTFNVVVTSSIIHLKGYAYGQTSSGNIQLGGSNTRACSVYASGDNPIPKASTAEQLQGDYYPIPIPQGSSSVTVSMPNDLYVGISWNDTAYSSDYSSPWLSANNATADVSSYSDGEHFVAFTYKSGSAGTTDMTNYDMSSVSITFS